MLKVSAGDMLFGHISSQTHTISDSLYCQLKHRSTSLLLLLYMTRNHSHFVYNTSM